MISTFTLVVVVTLIAIIYYLRPTGRKKTRRLRLYDDLPRKRAIDHYQIAAEYDYELGDAELAHFHYDQALRLAPENPADFPFIIDRIGQRIQRHATQQDEQHHFELQLQRVWDQTRQHAPAGAPTGALVWHEDTQNVHDSLLSDTVADNYRDLVQSGRGRAATPLFDMMHEMRAARGVDGAPLVGVEDAVKMLGYINRHDAHVTKLFANETVLVQEVWKQVKRVGTPDIMQSFCTQLQDSWHGGTPYCVTGRVSRVMQSLAHMVPDMPKVGQLKTREALRNEIFQSASNILQAELKKSELEETWAKEDKSDEEERETELLIERVRAQTSKMVDSYTDIAEEDREKIKQECYAAL